MFKIIFSLLIATLVFVITPASEVRAECSPTLSKPNLTAMKASGKGWTHLSWNKVENANRYALVYGFMPGNYTFGALSIDGGNETHYMVGSLQPGVTYYYQIWAFCNDNEAPSMSNVAAFKTI